PQLVPCLLDRQVRVVPQHHAGPLPGRQRCQRPGHIHTRRRGLVVVYLGRFEQVLYRAPAPAPAVGVQVEGDDRPPHVRLGVLRPLLAVRPAEPAEHLGQGVLDQVLTVAGVPAQQRGVPGQRCPTTAHQLGEHCLPRCHHPPPPPPHRRPPRPTLPHSAIVRPR